MFPSTTLFLLLWTMCCMCTLAVLFPSFTSCTSPLFFFLAQHCIGRSLDPNVQHWDLHSLRRFQFPALLLDYTHFVFFFLAQHCIGRSLDPNDHHWEMHSVRPFHFPVLLLDCTQCKFIFLEHNTTSGDLWIQKIKMR